MLPQIAKVVANERNGRFSKDLVGGGGLSDRLEKDAFVM